MKPQQTLVGRPEEKEANGFLWGMTRVPESVSTVSLVMTVKGPSLDA